MNSLYHIKELGAIDKTITQFILERKQKGVSRVLTPLI